MASVRGYEERELTGDLGILLRADLLTPGFDLGALPFKLRPLVFVDAGHVSNHKGLPCRGLSETSCTVSSVGVGARVAYRSMVSGTLDIGRALQNGVTTSKGDMRVHVSVTVAY